MAFLSRVVRSVRQAPLLYQAERSKVRTPFGRELPSWHRRGGAKRRGGRSQAVALLAFRLRFCERPPRALLLKEASQHFLQVASSPPVPGGELASKHP